MNAEANDDLELFCLQHWIPARTIHQAGYWDWDLGCIFRSQQEAETDQAEFHWEDDLTRIVKLRVTELEVVRVFEAEQPERRLKEVQQELFV